MSGPANRWFERADSEATFVAPVRSLVLDKEKWTLTALSLPADEKSSVSSVATLYGFSKANADQYITRLAVNDSTASPQSKAQSEAYLAGTALKDWKSDRQTKKERKIGVGVQGFLCTVGDFLHSFSGIAEIVKAADQQFGGLAYGTVVVLATVAGNKQRREESIEEMLEELAHAFPRLNTLQELHPEQNLRRLILDVFGLTIRFCRETVDYFTTSSVARMKKAINPKELKMTTFSQLRIKLTEIRREVEFAILKELKCARDDLRELRIRLSEIQVTNKDIQVTGKDTNSRVQENQTWLRREANSKAKEACLYDLKRRLQLKDTVHIPVDLSIAKVTAVLRDLSERRYKRKRGLPMSASMLKQDSTFSAWLGEPKSSILVLGGYNWVQDSGVQVNWLSYASVWSATATQNSDRILAFFCQTVPRIVSPRNKRRYPDICCSLIYQLAEQSPLDMQPRIENLEATLESPEAQSRDPQIAFARMTHLLVELLAMSDQKLTVTIVIDRLDQSGWLDNENNEVDALKPAIEALLDLVRSENLGHLTVKVLLVMDEGLARQVRNHFESYTGRGLEWKTDWHQEADDR